MYVVLIVSSSYIMMKVINLITPAKVTAEEIAGLDNSLNGEIAYEEE